MRVASMLRPLSTLAVAAVVAAGCSETPVSSAPEIAEPRAIIGGTTAGDAYRAVGGLVYDLTNDALASGSEVYCSGVLVAPNAFLTAAHCVYGLEGGGPLRITFAADVTAPASSIATTAVIVDPRYALTKGRSFDLAIVKVAPASTAGIAPVPMAAVNELDALASSGALRAASFVNVGYGANATRTGRPTFSYADLKLVSRSPFKSLNQRELGLQMNINATGQGGDCYGDSGGPKLLEKNGVLTVYAIVSWGDMACRSTSWNWRIDTPDAQAFIQNAINN